MSRIIIAEIKPKNTIMNIEKVKHEVLNNNLAIEYDNGDLEKLNEVLKYIFPKDVIVENYFKKIYFYRDVDCENHLWLYNNNFEGKSIPLSQITFDNEITLNDVIELRKKFPNNLIFGDEFDKLIKNLK